MPFYAAINWMGSLICIIIYVPFVVTFFYFGMVKEYDPEISSRVDALF